jgi:hypothetical protein
MMSKAIEVLEMKVEHRAKLRELAARRGGEPLSDLVSEAIEHYLASDQGDEGGIALDERRDDSLAPARRAALALRGSLTDTEAEELASRAEALRRSWR